MTSYRWKGFDGKIYSKDSALVRIKVNSVNDPPEVNDFQITAYEDGIVRFRKADFVLSFKDVENDELK